MHGSELHDPYVWDVAFSDDGKFFAAAVSWQRIIRVWETSSGNEVAVLIGHQDAVESVDFVPKKYWVASASRDGCVIVWDLATGQPRLVFKKLGSLSVIRASHNGHYLATGGDDGTLRILDIDVNSRAYGKCIDTLELGIHCKGLRLSGARGLERERIRGRGYWSTLLEYFERRGAILDNEQKQLIARFKRIGRAKISRKGKTAVHAQLTRPLGK